MLGRAGHDLVHDRFCIELMVDAVESIYDEGARSVRPSEVRRRLSRRTVGRCEVAPRPLASARDSAGCGSSWPSRCPSWPRSSPASPTVDLTYHLRAGAGILDDRRHPDASTPGPSPRPALPWVDQQWGAQVILAAVYPARRLDRAGPAARAARRRSSSAASSSIGRRRGLVDPRRGAADARRVRRRGGGPGAAPAARSGWRSSRSCCCWSPTGAPTRGRLWLDPARRPRLGQHPRQLLPGAARPRARLARGSPRSCAAAASRVAGVAVVSAVAACVTPFGPAVWAYAVGLSTNPARHPAHHRVAADLAPDDPRASCSSRSALGVVGRSSRDAAGRPPGRRSPGSASSSSSVCTRSAASRGGRSAPSPRSPALLVIEPARGPAAARVVDPPLIRRLNLVVAGAHRRSSAIALLPVWRPIDPGLEAPVGRRRDRAAGITAALREHGRPGRPASSTRSRGARGSSSRCRTCRSPIDSRIELFPASVWDDYEQRRRGWRRLAGRSSRPGT